MSGMSAGLRRLHELHLQLREIQEQLAKGPREKAAREQTVQKRKAELEAQRGILKQLRSTADQKNLQLKSSESKILELGNKLNSAGSNREYDILTGQIQADTMANSVLEDEILEALDSVDSAQGAVKEAEGAIVLAENELKKTIEAVQAREPGLKEREAELQTQVADAEKFLPPDAAGVYRRLVQAHGADALAAVEDSSCGSCYVKLTNQNLLELRMGKTLFCKTCGRLLYLPEDL